MAVLGDLMQQPYSTAATEQDKSIGKNPCPKGLIRDAWHLLLRRMRRSHDPPAYRLPRVMTHCVFRRRDACGLQVIHKNRSSILRLVASRLSGLRIRN